MPDMKPGQEETPAGTPATPPQNDAATAQGQPPQAPTAPPPSTQEGQPSTEMLPATMEEFQSRLEAERKKTLDEYRAKAGAEGGWMAALTPEDREDLKANPWRLREMKAKIEGYEKAMSALGQKQDPGPQEPDPLEAEVTELVELAARQDIEPKVFYRKMVEVQRKIARREAEAIHTSKFQPSYEAMTYDQQKQAVLADPRMKDPTFEALVLGIDQREHRRTGRWLKPLDVLALAEKEQKNGSNGHAAETPRATPALGEPRSISSSAAAPSLSIAERFARTASGKRMLSG